MEVSALRMAACAGVVLGALMLGGGAPGLALADPGGRGHGHSDERSSKDVNLDGGGLAHLIQRILGDHRKGDRHESNIAPRVKFGSRPDSTTTAGEPSASTFAGADVDPVPDVTPTDQRAPDPEPSSVDTGGNAGGGTDPAVTDPGASEPATTDTGGGSDYLDNVAVASDPVSPPPASYFGYQYYLWELRHRGGGDWWNVNRIASSFQQVISPLLQPTPPPTPAPEPQQVIGPAFRGPAPEPEPVLDASGGVTGGGGGYAPTGADGDTVLSAPIVAIPVPPPASARFPAFPTAPPAAASATPGVGSAVARSPGTDPAGTQPVRTTGLQQAPSETVKAMSGQSSRQQGYSDYLRRPGLPQLAGAALPGVAGIALMTLGGGIVGYRQASAGRMIRASGAARYLP